MSSLATASHGIISSMDLPSISPMPMWDLSELGSAWELMLAVAWELMLAMVMGAGVGSVHGS